VVQPVARLWYHRGTGTMAQLRRTSHSSVTRGSLPPSLHVALTAVATVHAGKNTKRISYDGWMSEVKTPNRTTRRCAMIQALGRRPLTVETRVRSQGSSCGICSGQNSSGTGFSPDTSLFHCQYHSNAPHFMSTLFLSRQRGQAWEPSQKQPTGNLAAVDRKVLAHLYRSTVTIYLKSLSAGCIGES
jgi:hypothetical protein